MEKKETHHVEATPPAVRAFGDEFAHHGVKEAGEGFDGIGVFPFFVVQQIHGGERDFNSSIMFLCCGLIST